MACHATCHACRKAGSNPRLAIGIVPPGQLSTDLLPNTRAKPQMSHVIVDILESRLVEQTTARQHPPTRDGGIHLQMHLSTHRSPVVPSHLFPRRLAGLLHDPARETCAVPCVCASDRPAPWKCFEAGSRLQPHLRPTVNHHVEHVDDT